MEVYVLKNMKMTFSTAGMWLSMWQWWMVWKIQSSGQIELGKIFLRTCTPVNTVQSCMHNCWSAKITVQTCNVCNCFSLMMMKEFEDPGEGGNGTRVATHLMHHCIVRQTITFYNFICWFNLSCKIGNGILFLLWLVRLCCRITCNISNLCLLASFCSDVLRLMQFILLWKCCNDNITKLINIIYVLLKISASHELPICRHTYNISSS